MFDPVIKTKALTWESGGSLLQRLEIFRIGQRDVIMKWTYVPCDREMHDKSASLCVPAPNHMHEEVWLHADYLLLGQEDTVQDLRSLQNFALIRDSKLSIYALSPVGSLTAQELEVDRNHSKQLILYTTAWNASRINKRCRLQKRLILLKSFILRIPRRTQLASLKPVLSGERSIYISQTLWGSRYHGSHIKHERQTINATIHHVCETKHPNT